MENIDWNEYHRLVEEMKRNGLPDSLAKVLAYEKVKGKDIYSPYDTINS